MHCSAARKKQNRDWLPAGRGADTLADNMKRETLPLGCWPSAISAELVAGKSLRLGALQADKGSLYWSESRPDEGGRGVILRAGPDGCVSDMLPAPWSARSKVHEYGGGEFLASSGRIFFVEAGDQDIFELIPDEAPKRLTNEQNMRFADMAFDASRNRLIAIAERHEAGSHNPENLLVSISLDAGEVSAVQTLSEGRDFYATPRIGPDGNILAWLSWGLPHMPWERASLHVTEIESDGSLGMTKHVAGGESSAVFQPGWLADGRLGFIWDKGGWGRMHVLENGDLRPLTPEGLELMRPQWVFGMQSWVELDASHVAAAFIEDGETWLGSVDLESGDVSRIETSLRSIDSLAPFNGGIALIGASDVAAPAVMALDENGNEAVLRSAGETGLDDADISKGEVLQFPSNGEDVYALYYAPASARFVGLAGEIPPTIILAHGGPTGMADRGLKLKIQYWTNRGFAVCDLDYSGSAGYGRAYRERLDGQWGIRDVADVDALTDFLVDARLADPDRFLISGGSAGGYTVLMSLAVLDKFAAGGCTYGVSDLSQLQRITHKFEAGYLYGLTGTTEADCEPVFAERSPLLHADKISCPVVFFQGADDKVVPPEQSRSMAETLRRSGVPVAYMEFEGEGHGFRCAETIVDVLESEYAFYARVLGLGIDGLRGIEIENF